MRLFMGSETSTLNNFSIKKIYLPSIKETLIKANAIGDSVEQENASTRNISINTMGYLPVQLLLVWRAFQIARRGKGHCISESGLEAWADGVVVYINVA